MKPVDAPLVTDPAHLANLKREARDGSTENLREVARQFESVFTHMLMKNMRAASLGEGAMDSDQSRFYQDMFDQQLSTQLSRGSGLGIADLLVKQLGGQESVTDSKPSAHELKMPNRMQESFPLARPTAVGEKDESSAPVEFVKKLLPHARRVGQILGVAPQLILAQAALETGWGQKTIQNKDGSESNNVFGIKAGSGWTGNTTDITTHEVVSGVARKITAPFRSYASLVEGFNDYAQLLLNNPRYQSAVGSGDDGDAFASGLKKGGYATDPDYQRKIVDIANGETLKNAMHVTRQINQR